MNNNPEIQDNNKILEASKISFIKMENSIINIKNFVSQINLINIKNWKSRVPEGMIGTEN